MCYMPLERSKQTIEPNSGVWDKDDLGAQCSDGAGQGPNRDSLRGDNDARLSLLVRLRPSDRATAGAMALAAARNGRVTAASAAPHPQRPAQPLLRRAALHHGGEQLARAQRAYEPSSLGAAGAPPLGSAQRRRVPAPASHPQQRWQRCCGLGSSSAVVTVGCARLSNDRQARRSRS